MDDKEAKITFTPGFPYERRKATVHNKEFGKIEEDYCISGELSLPKQVCPIHIRENGERAHFLMDIVAKHGASTRSVFDLADLICRALNIASEKDPKFLDRLKEYSDAPKPERRK